MLREGTMPVVKFSLCTMMLKMVEMTAPASMDRNCIFQTHAVTHLGKAAVVAI